MSASGPVPPFYPTGVGPNGHIIDERVLKAAEALWPACCGEVRRKLADDGCTAELVEAVAEKVSDRGSRRKLKWAGTCSGIYLHRSSGGCASRHFETGAFSTAG